MRQEQEIIGAEQRNTSAKACGAAFFEHLADKLRAEIISFSAVRYAEAAGDATEQAVSEKRVAFHHAAHSCLRPVGGSVRNLKADEPAERFPVFSEKAAVGAFRRKPARERKALAQP